MAGPQPGMLWSWAKVMGKGNAMPAYDFDAGRDMLKKSDMFQRYNVPDGPGEPLVSAGLAPDTASLLSSGLAKPVPSRSARWPIIIWRKAS